MRRRRIARYNGRGLSPIVSVVLLILIAVAASVLIYTWMSGLASKAPTTEPTLQEKIKIDSVSVDDNGTYANITIYVRNIGGVAFNISGAYIVDAVNGSIICYNTTTNIRSVQISPGSVEQVEITNRCPSLEAGRAYIAKVVTERGTEATYTFTRT